jgi:hypothetical protein
MTDVTFPPLPQDYVEAAKECATLRRRTLYAWMDENNPKSTVHLSMVPHDKHYWIIKPSGSVTRITGVF